MNTWLIAEPSAKAGAIETLPETPGLRVLTKNELLKKDLRFSSEDKVCITSEIVIDEVISRLEDSRLQTGIGVMKDKTAFREALQPLFPDFFFQQIETQALSSLKLNPEKSYVVKPVKGCFGSGVRVINGNADLQTLEAEIKIELARNSALFSDSVLSPEQLIVEECVVGEEFAVDMFYTRDGKPMITNIYHHPMPRNPAYLHMMYYTSAEVFSSIYQPAQDFFQQLNEILNLSQIPIHAEFRLQGDKLVPIELNSLRFGGMGLANLSYYGFGSNAYQSFIDEAQPDWEAIWEENADKAFAFFIAYNGANANLQTHEPDWPSFRGLFSKIIHEVPFDYQQQLAFGILYLEELQERISTLLETEFDDYFVVKN